MPINNITTITTTKSEVFIGNQVFDVLAEYLRPYPTHQIFVLVDENTLQHCMPTLLLEVTALHRAEIIEIESGEAYKNMEICFELWKTLAAHKATRNALLINLGGGVITDMGGWIASSYKRGIDFINIPTTLLAQVDASVGGKTGVNLDGLKNAVGVFNEPKGVFIYPNFLTTLDTREMKAGFAEMLKHGLIKDADYWKKISTTAFSDIDNWSDFILDAVRIKNAIVQNDPLEKGARKLLNFGHTIGHAIESYSLLHDKNPLKHGEAIAIGIICESYISKKMNGLKASHLKEITTAICQTYDGYPLDDLAYHELIEWMKNDKKNEGNGVNFTLLSEIGRANHDKVVEVDLILESLNYYNTLNWD